MKKRRKKGFKFNLARKIMNSDREKILMGRKMLDDLLKNNDQKSSILVYIFLLKYANSKHHSGKVYMITPYYIQECLGMSLNTVYYALRRLEEGGMIEKHDQYIKILRYNEYLLDSSGFFEIPKEIFNNNFGLLSKTAIKLCLIIWSQLTAQFARKRCSTKEFGIKTLLRYIGRKSFTQIEPILKELSLFFEIKERPAKTKEAGVCVFIFTAYDIFKQNHPEVKTPDNVQPINSYDLKQKYPAHYALVFSYCSRLKLHLQSIKDIEDLIALYLEYGAKKFIKGIKALREKQFYVHGELGAYLRGCMLSL